MKRIIFYLQFCVSVHILSHPQGRCIIYQVGVTQRWAGLAGSSHVSIRLVRALVSHLI